MFDEEYDFEQGRLLLENTFCSLDTIVEYSLSNRLNQYIEYDFHVNCFGSQKKYFEELAKSYSSLLKGLYGDLLECCFKDINKQILIETKDNDVVLFQLKGVVNNIHSFFKMIKSDYEDYSYFSLKQMEFLEFQYAQDTNQATFGLKFNDFEGEFDGLDYFSDLYITK